MTNPTPGLVVASGNGGIGMDAAVTALRDGGSALDAVEAGIRQVESNRADTSVGLGGLPNILGEVEVDASIMEGRTRTAGSVGAVHGVEHAITLARRVLEKLPHVMLVGPGAERFAEENGLPRVEMLTESSQSLWRAHVRARFGDAPVSAHELASMVRQFLDPTVNTGTVNFIARGADGSCASGVSTSGWEGKYPGRLGDTPIIGAGNYADDRYGAATCTGHGESTIRCGTARSIVFRLSLGESVTDALQAAALDAASLDDPHSGGVDILAVDRLGNVGAITTGRSGATESTTFLSQMTDQSEAVVRDRLRLHTQP